MSADMEKILAFYEKMESNVRSYCRNFPAEFFSASGVIIKTKSGCSYIDFLSGCGSLNYGHNEPMMKAALIDYISNDGIALGLDMHTSAKRKFLSSFEKLILQPRNMTYKVMFTGPTGTNAVEAALKIARKTTGRSTVASFSNGFHGMTLGALTVTGNSAKRAGAGVALNDVHFYPYGCHENLDSLNYIEHTLSNPSSGVNIPAAFIVEVIQGEGGLNTLCTYWLRGLERIARRFDILLIIDDVQAGVGRSGRFFSFEESGISPDIITLAKSISGFGLPMALTLIKPNLDIWSPGEHNGTFRGNNHAFVTARTALEVFWGNSNFVNGIHERSEIIGDFLDDIVSTSPNWRSKGRGMMRGLDVGREDIAAEICHRSFNNGLILETTGSKNEVVKLMPALNIDKILLNKGMDIFKASALYSKSASQ